MEWKQRKTGIEVGQIFMFERCQFSRDQKPKNDALNHDTDYRKMGKGDSVWELLGVSRYRHAKTEKTKTVQD